MEDITLESLRNSYFAEVQATKNRLMITFRDIGARYAVTVNQGLPRTSDYGETLVLALGDSVRIASRNATLSIKPLPKGYEPLGFHLREEIDMRMHNKGLVVHETFLVLRGSEGKDPEHLLSDDELVYVKADVEELRRTVEGLQ